MKQPQVVAALIAHTRSSWASAKRTLAVCNRSIPLLVSDTLPDRLRRLHTEMLLLAVHKTGQLPSRLAVPLLLNTRTHRSACCSMMTGAWSKGHCFGTILVDLERAQVVDLLPTRSSQSLNEWLGRHPEVEVVGGIAKGSMPMELGAAHPRPRRSLTVFT